MSSLVSTWMAEADSVSFCGVREARVTSMSISSFTDSFFSSVGDSSGCFTWPFTEKNIKQAANRTANSLKHRKRLRIKERNKILNNFVANIRWLTVLSLSGE